MNHVGSQIIFHLKYCFSVTALIPEVNELLNSNSNATRRRLFYSTNTVTDRQDGSASAL